MGKYFKINKIFEMGFFFMGYGCKPKPSRLQFDANGAE